MHVTNPLDWVAGLKFWPNSPQCRNELGSVTPNMAPSLSGRTELVDFSRTTMPTKVTMHIASAITYGVCFAVLLGSYWDNIAILSLQHARLRHTFSGEVGTLQKVRYPISTFIGAEIYVQYPFSATYRMILAR